jgi:hypothetical protein
MTRNYATGICAKVIRVTQFIGKPWDKRITIEFDDQRTTRNSFAFNITNEIFFPFKEGQEVVLTLRKSVE